MRRARAASTNSFSFNDKNNPRTIRATGIHENAAINVTIALTDPLEPASVLAHA